MHEEIYAEICRNIQLNICKNMKIYADICREIYAGICRNMHVNNMQLHVSYMQIYVLYADICMRRYMQKYAEICN
jgi:hypothetical protein